MTEESAQAIDVDIAWAAALAKLTGQSGALSLTFASWAGALAPRSLLRTEAAYCPQCFGCDLEAGRPYERLLWRLASVNVCPVHRASLLSACWTCGRRRRALASWSFPGYCPECWAWLGWSGQVAQSASLEPTPWSIASTDLIEEALAKRSAVPPRGDMLRASITSALRLVGGNRAELARRLGLRSKTSVSAWLDATSRPRLDTALRLAAATGADLSSVLAGTPIFDVRERMRPPDSKAHRRLDWEKIGREVEREVRRKKPRTLAAMALHFEMDDREIKSHFPALARELVERRAIARSLDSLERRSRLVTQVEGIVTGLQRDGVYPNRRRVEAEMPPGVDLREAPLGAAWRRLRSKCAI